MNTNILNKCEFFYRLASEISGVKPFRQTPSFCGAASLHIVMDFYGKDIPEEKLAKLSKTTKKDGTEAPYLLEAAKKFGFTGFYLDDCEISDIKRWIDRDFPVIVDWFSTDFGHFSVVYKIDKNNIYLQDPELGMPRAIRLEDFSNIWFDFKEPKQKGLTRRCMLVVYPKSKNPELNSNEQKAIKSPANL